MIHRARFLTLALLLIGVPVAGNAYWQSRSQVAVGSPVTPVSISYISSDSGNAVGYSASISFGANAATRLGLVAFVAESDPGTLTVTIATHTCIQVSAASFTGFSKTYIYQCGSAQGFTESGSVTVGVIGTGGAVAIALSFYRVDTTTATPSGTATDQSTPLTSTPTVPANGLALTILGARADAPATWVGTVDAPSSFGEGTASGFLLISGGRSTATGAVTVAAVGLPGDEEMQSVSWSP